MLAGDFNSVRFPHERNSFHICTNEALFNDTIRDMAIQELSILDPSHGVTCSLLLSTTSWIGSSPMPYGMNFG
jgi:hypothetical protein